MNVNDAIIMWIARRIKDEERKHSKNNENWPEIAARKIFASYSIKLKNDNIEDECEYCGVSQCRRSCEDDWSALAGN